MVKSTGKKAKPELKKGKASWNPANRLPDLVVPDGMVGRWVRNDPINVNKKLNEGWVFTNKMKTPSCRTDTDSVDSTKGISGITINEMVGMVMPKDLAQARREYHERETEARTDAALSPNRNKSALAERSKMITETKLGKVIIN